ncbi:MAG: hypothetical protein ACOC5I_02330, partial [Gemmatimonadota bacterium]
AGLRAMPRGGRRLLRGQCHEPLFAEAGLPGCATCHGQHDVQRPDDSDLARVGTEVCARCHGAGPGRGSALEHRYRRIGLAVSAGFILLLIIGIVLKIRAMERPQRRDTGGIEHET